MKSDSRLSIFLVDEDPFFLSVCEQYLQKLGFANITKFKSSMHFLKNMQKQPDLVLLNDCFNSVNGSDELKRIGQFIPDALVVFISGQGNIDVVINAFKKGSFDCQPKNQNCEEKARSLLLKETTKKIFYRSKKSFSDQTLPLVGMAALILFILLIFAK